MDGGQRTDCGLHAKLPQQPQVAADTDLIFAEIAKTREPLSRRSLRGVIIRSQRGYGG